jgi:hypothetical protein
VAGDVLYYDFDISNIGDENVPGDFNVKAWISTDNVISADDIQNGTIPTGNYDAGLTITDVQGATAIPADLPAGLYSLILKVDADEEVAEANEGNNRLHTLFHVVNSGGIDLSLSMSATNNNPDIYTYVDVTLTVSNDGGQTATGVVVEFPKPSGTVYSGGNEWTATQGSFSAFGSEQWSVGDVPAGGTASITVTYFLLTENTLTPYAQVVSADQPDADSTPGNGSCCTPNEDDEGALMLNNFTGGGISYVQLKDNRQRLAFTNIYPTPVKYMATMEVFSKEDQLVVLDFYNQQGQSVHRMEVLLEEGENEVRVDVSEWRSGTYNVIGRGNGTPAYGRLVKVWE